MRQNFFRTLFVCAFLAWFFALAGPVSAAVIRHDGETAISADTIWHDGDVHVISGGSLSIDFGAKLSLEPGAIVKLDSNSAIIVAGKLTVQGSPAKPAVITSLKNDKLGGDTNGDGAATTPLPGDWASIMVPVAVGGQQIDGEVIIDRAVVSYGGRLNDNDYFTLVVGQSSKFAISNSEMFDNLGLMVILPQVVEFSLTSSNITAPNVCQEVEPGVNVCGGMIMSQSPAILDVSGNYWGHAGGPSVFGPDGVAWNGVALAGNFAYEPFSAVKLDIFASALDKRHPVIIIPGILGSWPDMEGQKLILDPILHTYDDLWLALIQAGYEAGESLFAFPYEWRNSNVLTAQMLKQKIEAVKIACVPSEIIDCSKVDLVAHSMGGLVARQYISQADYGNDVDQLIFIAVPHQGAPKAYAMWEGGYIGSGSKDLVLWSILALEASKITSKFSSIGLVTYLQNYGIESVRELLPIYHYLYDDDLGQVRYYPNNYPVNQFLENLNSLDNLAKLNSVVRRMTNIIGNSGNNTITGYNVLASTEPAPLWSDGMPKDFYGTKTGVLIGGGDSTVPTISSDNFLDLSSISVNQDHEKVVSFAQSEVIEELTGSVPPSEIHSNSSPSYLMISLRCPADIQIIAPDGQRLGRDELTSSTLAEIPGGYYHYSDDSLLPEYAIIPNPLPGEYQVRVVGTANGGAYSVDTDYFNETTTTSTTYSGVILPGLVQSLIIDAREATSTGLTVAADITIDSAIADVNELFDRGLLTDKNGKKKLIHQYEEAKRKVEVLDRIIDLAGDIKIKDERYGKLDRFKKVINRYIYRNVEKLLDKRQKEIGDAIREIDKEIAKLLAKGKLNQLGYDIIKSNNDYLINNW